jgi:hypothetical protein
MHAVLQLAPMGRRFPKFVGDKFVRKGVGERERILFAGYLFGNGITLLAGGVVAPLSQIVELLKPVLVDKRFTSSLMFS